MQAKWHGFWASRTLVALLFAALPGFVVVDLGAQSETGKTAANSPAAQKSFSTPQQATAALIQAAANYDVPALLEIFGPDGKDFVSSSDPVRDKKYIEAFAAKAREKYSATIDPANPARAMVSVGDDQWPLPVPLVKKGGKWYFDSKLGHDEILLRRIGANELDAIEVCRGYVEAQKEYAAEIHDDSGVNQYAQKIISTTGKHDGLVWRNEDGTLGGPISKPIADAIVEGYSSKAQGYHGYYFKVLKGQGPSAPLGQLDYVIEGAMIGGFALVATPVEYRVTGVKSFMVSYDGVVYEKDLGPESQQIFASMERYNPDKTWQRTDDEWSADNLASNE